MPQRVLHLITRFLHGGAETTTVNTLDALRTGSREYDLHLGFGAAYDPEHVADVEATGVTTTSFSTLRHYNPLTQVLSFVEIAFYLRRHEIDIVHTHSTEAGIVGRYAAALAGVPVVIHEIHGYPITSDRSDLFNQFLLTLERSAAPLATTLIVKSERIRTTYLDHGVGHPDQYVTIYHGIDFENYREATPATDPPRQADCRLLFVGRIAEGKGLFDLLGALERLSTDHSVELLVAGDGPLAERLDRDARSRGLEHVVSLLGYREDVPALLASSDIFVLPSYREGTPRGITEALAAGVPVVSTDIAGIPEQVTEGTNGYLVEPGDVAALTDRLERLVADDDHRARFASRTSIGLEKFDLETVQCQYRVMYGDLVDECLGD